MKIEVLAASMNSSPLLYRDMKIQTDAVIINQCDKNDEQIFYENGRRCRFLSFAERGIGNSRNRALSAAEGDILLFADDDVEYVDGYEQIVFTAFEKHPKADAIIFNINVHGGERNEVIISSDGEMNFKEALSFGAVRLAVKRDKIRDINFSLLFGGGAKYGSGEDTLFIQDLFRRGLCIYRCADVIADVRQDESSWFEGYTDKYFFDKGALYGALWGKKAKLLSILTAARWCKKLDRHDYFHILGLYFKGIDDFKENNVK